MQPDGAPVKIPAKQRRPLRPVTALVAGTSISGMRVNQPPSMHPLTVVGHADAGEDDDTALAPPIIQTSAFRARSGADFEEMAGPRYNRYYTRDGNPTFTRVEKIIAELEGAETALLTASGMGAMSASVLAHVSKGEHVVAQRSHYMGTTQLLTDVLPRFGVEVTHVDQTSISALGAAVRDTTKLIIVETPANPLLKLTDLAAVAAIARPRGILTICDSTMGRRSISNRCNWASIWSCTVQPNFWAVIMTCWPVWSPVAAS